MLESDMSKFEFRTQFTSEQQTIEAADYQMDTKDGKLTFTDENKVQMASFSISQGAYVKRITK